MKVVSMEAVSMEVVSAEVVSAEVVSAEVVSAEVVQQEPLDNSATPFQPDVVPSLSASIHKVKRLKVNIIIDIIMPVGTGWDEMSSTFDMLDWYHFESASSVPFCFDHTCIMIDIAVGS
jgi:hypothetical protein